MEEKGRHAFDLRPQLDNEKQLQGIRDMLDQGMDLLVLGPVDADGVRPALEACRKAGVPVVCFDSKATDAELLATFVGGRQLPPGPADRAGDPADFPQGGSLGLLTNPLAHSVTERERGLRDALAGSEVEVAACLEVTGYDEVLPKAERILSEHPEIDILWGLNDDITLLLHSSVLAIGQEDRVSIYGTGGCSGSGAATTWWRRYGRGTCGPFRCRSRPSGVCCAQSSDIAFGGGRAGGRISVRFRGGERGECGGV